MPPRRIKRRRASTTADLVAKARRAACGVCGETGPIAMVHDIDAPAHCLPIAEWADMGGVPEWVDEGKDVCYECQAEWTAWLLRVCAVLSVVRARVGKSGPRLARLGEILNSEAFHRAHPELDKWERKLGVAA